MLLQRTQDLLNEFGEKFTDGTITDEDLTNLYTRSYFQPNGEKDSEQRPGDTAYTKMEAMFDFVTTITPKMSEKQLLQLIPKLFELDKKHIHAKFMRQESLAKYFLVMTAILFPKNEEALLNSYETESAPLNDEMKPLYQTVSNMIKTTLFNARIDVTSLTPSEKDKKDQYPELHRRFMIVIWSAKIRLLIHIAEDKTNSLNSTTNSLIQTAKAYCKSTKEFIKATKNLTPTQEIEGFFKKIMVKKTIEMRSATLKLDKNDAHEMIALYDSLTKLNDKLDVKLRELNTDKKETLDACTNDTLHSVSSSPAPMIATRLESQLARQRPESSRSSLSSSGSMWGCLFSRRPTPNGDGVALISTPSDSNSPNSSISSEALDNSSPPPKIIPSIFSPSLEKTAQRPTVIRRPSDATTNGATISLC